MKYSSVKLNFHDQYYMFYDWLYTDNIKVYKDVPILKVSSEVINDFLNYKFIIKSKEKFNGPYVFTDSYTYIGILFDNNKMIKKSSLLLEDEFLLEYKVDSLKRTNIIYEKYAKDIMKNEIRLNIKIRQTIENEINKIVNEENFDKLQYLYYEWFKKCENDQNKMKDSMLKKIKNSITNNEMNIYDLIVQSNKNV